MTVQIKTQFVRDIPSEGVYRVKVDVIDVVDIDFDVLVFTTDDAQFSRVASPFDMETYVVGQTAANSANQVFFRGRGAELSFPSVLDATTWADITEQRLKQLAVDWEIFTSEFAGTEIITVDSTTS